MEFLVDFHLKPGKYGNAKDINIASDTPIKQVTK
jgi:hypothetical protein